jgi:hypothetical protein
LDHAETRPPFDAWLEKPASSTVRHATVARTFAPQDEGAGMKPRLKLFADAPIGAAFLAVSVFLATSIAAGADETRIKVARTETSPIAGPAGMQQPAPHGLQLAQCQPGHAGCLTRPQEKCGPGLDDCLSRGQSDCKDVSPALKHPSPNTAGLDNALKNPNLSPERRAELLKTKAALEASQQRAASSHAGPQYARCLQNVVRECRINHC